MNERLGELAYNAYCDSRALDPKKSERPEKWIDLPAVVKRAWIAAAEAVNREIEDQVRRSRGY